jgi:ABC-type lipoprotein release transport system permease subunit
VTTVARLAWRNLWRHAGRTLLTASGVALGLAFLLVMLGLGDGSHLQMIDAAVRMGSGHVLLQAPEFQRRRGVEMTMPESSAAAVVRWARSRPDVEGVLPRAFASALLSSADGATGVSLVAVDAAAEAPLSRFPARVTHGRFLEAADRNTAVVGAGVARLLEVGVGSRVVAMAQGARSGEVRSALLHVAGVLDTGLDDIDRSLVLVPLRAGQEFLELGGGVHQIALVLDDQAAAGARAREAAHAFPDLEILTWAQADPDLAAAIRIDDGGHYLFNGIFFVIIGFMVLNTLLMSVLERRREFALLGALGLSPRRRLAVVVAEGAMLAALASGGGLALGLGAHTYFRLHGLPLAWFTAQGMETAGVMLEPVMYSSLSGARIVGAVALVWLLTLGLSLAAARQAARPVDPGLLK